MHVLKERCKQTLVGFLSSKFLTWQRIPRVLSLEGPQRFDNVAWGFYSQFLGYVNEEGSFFSPFPNNRKRDHLKLDVLRLNLVKGFLTAQHDQLI